MASGAELIRKVKDEIREVDPKDARARLVRIAQSLTAAAVKLCDLSRPRQLVIH